MSTLSLSAWSLACGVGRTLKPMMIAFEASAKVTSDSLIAPTAWWMIFTRTPSTSIFLKLCAKASAEPCTSALMIRSTSFRFPSFKVSNKLSKVTCVVWLRSLIKARLARSSPAARAVFSSSNVIKRSPESGTSFRPVI